MANVNRPSGFSPVKSLTSAAFNEQGNLYAIANDSSNTYAIGDVVRSATGATPEGIRYVTKWGGATTTNALPLGIIVGFATPGATGGLEGVPLTLEKGFKGKDSGLQYVYVVDDPHVVFEVQFDNTAVTAADLAKNAAVTITGDQTSLSQASPQSSAVLTSPAATATLPVRLLGAVQREGNEVGAYVRVLAKWNYHENGVTAGASGSVVGYLGL